MAKSALDKFVEAVRSDWGPLNRGVTAACSRHLANLLAADGSEPWLADLHHQQPLARELYRDTDHGFVLLAHTEPAGLYRPPHDHGRAWVIYGVQRGESEMGTYDRLEGADAQPRLVRRNATRVAPGQVQVYLPGDIHDTRCTAGPALLFRFTERDLKVEDKVERRITRYVEREGVWTVGVA
ncbi:hypothetical protein M9M90_07095 [Phenylobacterium sp. LH3H17]|uniref:hypothetical protein n=1 Tax=Phenylobacterium sp. LH3H17 TaxID=2903901 RepID=UPI0020C94347|nr:hypothetical protein [Phenylobacterium sp. LH3H17]UTP40941.1 hypothetical protein M9M90_07095 [Phenylobacterium sp. LH3H17]